MFQYSLSVLCHFVAPADCIRSVNVGGQLVITRNMLSAEGKKPRHHYAPAMQFLSLPVS